MLDWLGSLRIVEISSLRLVLGVSRTTRLVGLACLLLGLYALWRTWDAALWLMVGPALLTAFGAALVSLSRRLDFNRADGVLRVEQHVFGIGSRTVVPLFHLRAVVIVVRPGLDPDDHAAFWRPARYVAYIDRRIGGTIYLDESRRCAYLLELAEAIAEVAELRLEYDAMSSAS